VTDGTSTPTDDWLTQMLRRKEYMPFAPAALPCTQYLPYMAMNRFLVAGPGTDLSA
jgi:hypothetical protein